MNRRKIHPLLRSQLEQAESDQTIPAIARLDMSRGLQPSLLSGGAVAAVRYQYRLLPMVSLLATPGQIYSLLDDPTVEQLWYDLPVHACLDFSINLIQASRLWSVGLSGRGVRVALLDTGLDAAHPDLRGRVAGSAVFCGEGLLDRNGHGTHVAGIVAGSGSASDGRFTGVAPGASLLIAKVLDDHGNGWSSDVMAGLDWAVLQGARVANLSLSSDHFGDGSDALSLVCDAAVQQGLVICVAAGNQGPTAQTIGAPGCARHVITVGASTDADGIAEFTGCGPTADARIKPDILFPGALIVSTRARGAHMGASQGELYTEASGASMATAHASGAAALLLEANPELTPAEIKAALLAGAKDLGRNPQMQGAGRGDVYAALRAIQRTTPPPSDANTWSSTPGWPDAGAWSSAPEWPDVGRPRPAVAAPHMGRRRSMRQGIIWASLAFSVLLVCLCSLAIVLGGLDSALWALETRTATPTVSLNVLLRQDFSAGDAAWPTAESAADLRGVAEGRYYLIARQPQALVSQVIPGRYDNVVVEVEAGQTDGPAGGAYGLMLRQRDNSNFYYAGLSSQGSYSFARLVGGQWQEIIPWTPSPAVLGVGYLNRLRVEARGNRFTLWANGEVLAVVEDGTFASGSAALFTASFEQGNVRTDFDNLTVWAAPP